MHEGLAVGTRGHIQTKDRQVRRRFILLRGSLMWTSDLPQTAAGELWLMTFMSVLQSQLGVSRCDRFWIRFWHSGSCCGDLWMSVGLQRHILRGQQCTVIPVLTVGTVGFCQAGISWWTLIQSKGSFIDLCVLPMVMCLGFLGMSPRFLQSGRSLIWRQLYAVWMQRSCQWVRHQRRLCGEF